MGKPVYWNKLVRDKIPDHLEEKRITHATRIADRAEYRRKLIEKLKEEAEEFARDETQEELADVLQVLIDIAADRKWSLSSIEKLRMKKLKEKGGFEKRIILVFTQE